MLNPIAATKEVLRFLFGTSGLGKTFYVDSVNGNASFSGTSSDKPLTTIAAAVTLCVANRGDKVVCMPGHAETVSTAGGITLSKAGVSIVGLGKGTNRPTLTLSAVVSSVIVSAANVKIDGLLFLATHDNTIMLDLNSTDTEVANCEFRSTTGKEPVTMIDINGGAANACDRVYVHDCRFTSVLAAGCNRAIELGEVADQVRIERCTVLGDFGDACIHNPTGKVLTNLYIGDCVLENTQTGDHSIELVSACTGFLVRNMYKNDMTQATGCDPGSCFSFQCFHDDVIDTSAILCPAVT